MQSLPIRYFDTHTHGDIMSLYTNDTDTLRQMIAQSMAQLVSSVFTLAAVFFCMLYISIWLTLIVCAVMALIHPEIFTIRPMYVQVETGGEYCRGTTVGDLLGFSGHAPNADVLMDVDRSRFADLLVEAIGFYGEAKA